MKTEDNFLDFQCPYCGMLNSFPLDSAGYVRECVKCMEALIVPEDGSEIGGKIPIPITTPRLVLRPLSPSDSKDLLETRSDLDEEDWIPWLNEMCKVKLTCVDETFNLGIELRDKKRSSVT